MANIDVIKILGSLLNSGALSRGSGSDILGSVIGAVTGGGSRSSGGQSGGGLGDLMGSVLGGGQSRGGGGGLGDILGGLVGGGRQAGASSGGGGLGDLLAMAMKQFGAGGKLDRQQMENELPGDMSVRQAEEQANVLIKAMVNAAKSDGQVDREEQQKIVGKLGDVTRDELEFVQRELSAPLDARDFIRSVPRGMEQQVYAVSLMTIDLDSNAEAQYLHQLAQGLDISPDVCNQIHQQLGAPQLYR